MAPNNSLPIHGNEKTMNLNNLILTNILSSPYFKNNLYELKTYHEVIDEIYYKVNHLEPWEKGSRKTAGQTGMCGGVRGVGAGGIVSSAFCLLYKLFTLRLTRKQVNGLINHKDSAYIRGLGFLYIRYTQPPADLWEWYAPYLDDEEEVDVKAGGGCVLPIGEIARQFMVKLEWWSTLFPRIPVPIQKSIENHMRQRNQEKFAAHEQELAAQGAEAEGGAGEEHVQEEAGYNQKRPNSADRPDFNREPERNNDRNRNEDRHSNSRSRDGHKERKRSRSREPYPWQKSTDRRRSRSRDRSHRRRERSRSRDRHSRPDRYDKYDSRSRDRHHRPEKSTHSRRRSRSPRDRGRSDKGGNREDSFERDLRRERERQKRSTSDY
ncbi:pre-mRNA-splicing factor 38B-like [Lineus longissimus]|uniref:pre-mRNA-splicing factor 38B-like n=1 Tax=Lineus longissimus TaxID=88925 RepID=UPI002B4D63B9